MSEFHKEVEHVGFALLFDSFKIEDKFAASMKDKVPHFVVKGREEQRVSAMLDSAEDLAMQFYKIVTSAVSCVAIASTFEDAVMMQAGLIKIVPQGLNICTACLAKAIFACEEQLTVLKDIQEMSKEYAAKL